MPSKTGHDTVAITFVLHFQHYPFVRLINTVNGLCHHTIETSAFEDLGQFPGYVGHA